MLDVRFTEAEGTLVRLVHSGWTPGTEEVREKYTHWGDLLHGTPPTCRDTPLVRPMRVEDLEAFAEITSTSYHEVDTRTHQRAWPDPVRRPAGPQRPLDPTDRAGAGHRPGWLLGGRGRR